MADVRGCGALLLAAGLSRRFGAADKLTAPFEGRPLAEHAARQIAALPLAARVAVVNTQAGDLHGMLEALGFELAVNHHPERGLSSSLAIGAARLAAIGAEMPIVVALADMPLVPAYHLAALCEALSPDRPVVASLGLERPTVPAAFGEPARLQQLEGDVGARALLADAATIPIAASCLVDIDRQADLTASSERRD